MDYGDRFFLNRAGEEKGKEFNGDHNWIRLSGDITRPGILYSRLVSKRGEAQSTITTPSVLNPANTAMAKRQWKPSPSQSTSHIKKEMDNEKWWSHDPKDRTTTTSENHSIVRASLDQYKLTNRILG